MTLREFVVGICMYFILVALLLTPVGATAADADVASHPLIFSPGTSVAAQKPVLKVSSACQTYTSLMENLRVCVNDYRDIWELLGPDYYRACDIIDPRYTLNKAKRELTTLIESARGARAAFVQVTSIDFVDKLDLMNDWYIPGNARDLQLGYPHVPAFLNKTNPFNETYNESRIGQIVESKCTYLRLATNRSTH